MRGSGSRVSDSWLQTDADRKVCNREQTTRSCHEQPIDKRPIDNQPCPERQGGDNSSSGSDGDGDGDPDAAGGGGGGGGGEIRSCKLKLRAAHVGDVLAPRARVAVLLQKGPGGNKHQLS